MLGLAAAGCSSAGSTTTTTTKPLPPLPPLVYAYVTVIGSGNAAGNGHTVVPVDVTASGGAGALAPIRVGTWPDAIAIAPGGRTAYVTNYTSNNVTVIDLATEKVVRHIDLGPTAGPAGIALAPNGRTAYVTEAGAPGTLGSTVQPIALPSYKLAAPIAVGGGPQGIAITPDGREAFVANAGAIVSGQTGAFGNTVTPINLQDDKPLAPIAVGNAPTGVAITPNGTTAIVTNLNSGSVSTITVANNQPGTPITIQGGPIAVATRPGDSKVAYTADTSSNTAGGTVTPIDLTTGTALHPIAVGKAPQAIAITPDGKTAWVVCYGSDTIESIDLTTGRAGATIKVAGGPSAIAITTRPRAGFPATTTTTTTSPKSKQSTTTTKATS